MNCNPLRPRPKDILFLTIPSRSILLIRRKNESYEDDIKFCNFEVWPLSTYRTSKARSSLVCRTSELHRGSLCRAKVMQSLLVRTSYV